MKRQEVLRLRRQMDSDPDALRRLEACNALRRYMDEQLVDLVKHARKQRRSWQDIASVLGVSRQAAHERYAPLIDGREDT